MGMMALERQLSKKGIWNDTFEGVLMVIPSEWDFNKETKAEAIFVQGRDVRLGRRWFVWRGGKGHWRWGRGENRDKVSMGLDIQATHAGCRIKGGERLSSGFRWGNGLDCFLTV